MFLFFHNQLGAFHVVVSVGGVYVPYSLVCLFVLVPAQLKPVTGLPQMPLYYHMPD